MGTVLSVGENFTYECFDERQTAFTNSATARALWNATPVEDSNIADVTVGSPYAAAVLGDGAVAYWRFGEASGSTAEDASGTLDATYVGPPTLGAAGLIDDTDTAADFDGTTDSVVVPNDALINTAGPYTGRTVELWFHADAVNRASGVVGRGRFKPRHKHLHRGWPVAPRWLEPHQRWCGELHGVRFGCRAR